MARGFCNFCTNSSSEFAPVAPSPESCFTLSGLRSYTTQVWPFLWSRRTMLAPIRPRPIIPSCIPPAPVNQIVKRKSQRNEKSTTGPVPPLLQARLILILDFFQGERAMRDARVPPVPRNLRVLALLSPCRTYISAPVQRGRMHRRT